MEKRIFELATITPYPVNDIIDFMHLTGLKIDETEKVINNFNLCGISNLVDVNTLAKLGLLSSFKNV